MKTTIFAAFGMLCLAFTGAAFAQSTAPSLPTLLPPPPAVAAPERSIVKVAGDVYRFQNNGHFGVFMVTPKGVILVDPINLDTANWVKSEIAARFKGAKVVDVLYSHHDWDHVAGAKAFDGAKIFSRAETVKDLAAPQDPVAREAFLKQYMDVASPTDTYTAAVKKITLGGKTVEMHYVQSKHADDLSYIYFPAEKVLFVVDVLSPKRLFYGKMIGYDEADSFASIDKALSFDTAFVVGGHGDIGTKQDVADQKQYLIDLREGVKTGIASGLTLDQIKAQLTLEKYASWNNYAIWRATNIEGMYAYLTKK
jgi:glyoxylase-like metal-dependent hydrolase (beta-lactamase superfamily II)